MLTDTALADKMLDSVCEFVVKEFRLMPDFNYQLTDEDTATCLAAMAVVGLTNDEKENK